MTGFPVVGGGVPFLTTAQMVEVDRAMIEDFHIGLIQMMENAGRGLAHLARSRFLNGDARGRHVVVLVGTGGNGGGALVAARRLRGYGATVTVIITRDDEAFAPVPAHQLDIARRIGLPILPAARAAECPPADLVLDGLIGYSLRGAPRGAVATLIDWANQQAAPILALDTPSGVDAGTGTVHSPAIRAAATLTLALPKTGFKTAEAASFVGELYLADIGVPPGLYARPPLRLAVGPVFSAADVIQIDIPGVSRAETP